MQPCIYLGFIFLLVVQFRDAQSLDACKLFSTFLPYIGQCLLGLAVKADLLKDCTLEHWAHDLTCHRVSFMASLMSRRVKNLPAIQENWVQFLGREDPLEESMATHSSSLA